MPNQQPVRQTVTLPADLAKAIDKLAADSKRSRNSMIEMLLTQAIKERERRFKKLHVVAKKIEASATEAEAAQYDEELMEAIFGPQKRSPR
jgi:hypothetical protein